MTIANTVANVLLDIEAVKINTQQPFQYASGIQSPIYCDNRRLISFPSARQTVIQAFIETITSYDITHDTIAGTATAGIPHAAWIADRLNCPMLYVRGSAKAHGNKQQIEGVYHPNQTALVIEDLISTGSSAITAAHALQAQDITVNHCLAIFDYQLPQTQDAFKQASIQCLCLTTLEALLEQAQLRKDITLQDASMVQQWQLNPKDWQP